MLMTEENELKAWVVKQLGLVCKAKYSTFICNQFHMVYILFRSELCM